MQTIQQYAHNGSLISVIKTNDPQYARQCFDGSDREWDEIQGESENDAYFIVSCGLAGCYMADEVSVFACREDALSSAKDTLERWQDEDADL